MKVVVTDLYSEQTNTFEGAPEDVRKEILAKYRFASHHGDDLESVLSTIGNSQGYVLKVEQ